MERRHPILGMLTDSGDTVCPASEARDATKKEAMRKPTETSKKDLAIGGARWSMLQI